MALTRRQAEFADAALGLLARVGMSAVTFRAVAAESGCSVGAVQKAYRSKEELLGAMFARLRDRAGPAPASEPGRPTLHAWLLELFVQIQPLDAHRRDLTLQGAAFSERAVHDESVAAAIVESDREVRVLLASLVQRARAQGEVGDVDPEHVAWAFLALAQGAATQLLYEPQESDVVRAHASAAITALLGPGIQEPGIESTSTHRI